MTAFSNTVTMLPAISCVHKEGSERLDLYPEKAQVQKNPYHLLEKQLPALRSYKRHFK